MLANRLRPCATQFGRFVVPLRVQRYSSVTEQSYEYIKVSTPRTGVAMSTSLCTIVDARKKETESLT